MTRHGKTKLRRLRELSRSIPSAWAAATLSIAHVCDAGAMLGQVTLTAALLTKEQFGTLGIAMAWTLVASALLDFRVWEVMTIMIPKLRAASQYDRAGGLVTGCFMLELTGGLVTSTLLFATAPIAAALLAKASSAAGLFAILAIQPLLMSADEPLRTILRLDGRFRRLAILRASGGITQLLLVAISLWLAPQAEAVASAVAIAWVLRIVALAVMSRHSLLRLGLTPLSGQAKIWVKPMLFKQSKKFRDMMLSAIAGRLANRVDILVLGWYSNPVVVAPYDLARRLTSQINVLLGPIEQVAFPKISTLIDTDPDECRRFIRGFAISFGVMWIPLISVAIAILPSITSAFFGPGYSSTGRYGQILLVAFFPAPIMWARLLIAASQQTGVIVLFGSAAVAIQLCSLYLLVPRHLGFGAAASVVISQFIWQAALFGWTRHKNVLSLRS